MKQFADLIRKYLLESINTDEALVLRRIPDKNMIAVQSDLEDKRKAGSETFNNKKKLKDGGFRWDSTINSWVTPDDNFQQSQKLINTINKTEVFIDRLEDLQEFVMDSDAPTKVNLNDKIKVFIDDLANATDEAAADAKIKQYLNFFSKIRKRSFTNTFLIFIQNPNATHVEGYKTWKTKFHRQVRKDAKSITIFAPNIYDTNKGNDGDGDLDAQVKERRITFTAKAVFDIADTDPIDERGNLPEEPQWFDNNTPNETADELYKYVEVVVEELGIKLTQTDAKGGEKGYSAGDHINLTSNIAGVGRLSTLVHELAHELMHWRKSSPFYDEENIKNNPSRESRELQAESVSYTVLRHYDIPVQHHATYLALWKANKDKITNNLDVIIKVSRFIIEKIDKVAEDFKKTEKQNIQEFINENIQIELEQRAILILPDGQKFDLANDSKVYKVNHPVFKMVEGVLLDRIEQDSQTRSKYEDDIDGFGPAFSKKEAIKEAIGYIRDYIDDKFKNTGGGSITWKEAYNNSDFESAF